MNGKVALVTGAGNGIGKATANVLAANAYHSRGTLQRVVGSVQCLGDRLRRSGVEAACIARLALALGER